MSRRGQSCIPCVVAVTKAQALLAVEDGGWRCGTSLGSLSTLGYGAAPSQRAVNWPGADLLERMAPRRREVWHDRAVSHFLTDSPRRRSIVAYCPTQFGTARSGAGRVGHVTAARAAVQPVGWIAVSSSGPEDSVDPCL